MKVTIYFIWEKKSQHIKILRGSYIQKLEKIAYFY